jgi:hypothetical protein
MWRMVIVTAAEDVLRKMGYSHFRGKIGTVRNGLDRGGMRGTCVGEQS